MIDLGFYCLLGHEVHRKPIIGFYHSFRRGFIRTTPHPAAAAFNAYTYTAST